jgi:hypothetical protein
MKRENQKLMRDIVVTRCCGVLTTVGVWTILFAAQGVCRADIKLFSNFGAGFAYNTSAGNAIGDGLDFTGFNYAQGDTFKPSTSAKLSSLDVALSNFFGTNSDTLTVSLDANGGGNAPGAALESFIVLPGVLGTLGNNNAPLVLISALHPLLTAGTQYWVTVSDATGTDSNVWNWNDTGDMSDEAISADGGASWFVQSGLGQTPGALQVNGMGTVPEPAGLVLLATVLLLLCLGKRGALLQNW